MYPFIRAYYIKTNRTLFSSIAAKLNSTNASRPIMLTGRCITVHIFHGFTQAHNDTKVSQLPINTLL